MAPEVAARDAAQGARDGCRRCRASHRCRIGGQRRVGDRAMPSPPRCASIEFDLLIVGGLTDDSSTGAVPGALAEHLRLPCITNARKVEIDGGTIKVERETDVGYQTVSGAVAGAANDGADLRRAALCLAQGHHGREEKDDNRTDARRSRARVRRRKRRIEDRARRASRPRRREARAQTIEAADGAAGARAIFDFLQEKKLV